VSATELGESRRETRARAGQKPGQADMQRRKREDFSFKQGLISLFQNLFQTKI